MWEATDNDVAWVEEQALNYMYSQGIEGPYSGHSRDNFEATRKEVVAIMLFTLQRLDTHVPYLTVVK